MPDGCRTACRQVTPPWLRGLEVVQALQSHLVAARGVSVQTGDCCLELQAGNLLGDTALQKQIPCPQMPCPIGPDCQSPITAGSSVECVVQAE